MKKPSLFSKIWIRLFWMAVFIGFFMLIMMLIKLIYV